MIENIIEPYKTVAGFLLALVIALGLSYLINKWDGNDNDKSN